MNWTELLTDLMNAAYGSTKGLMDLVDEDLLGWKPASGENWMTTGQLLEHLATSCGAPCKGFVTGDWGMPEGVSVEDMPPEDMLPRAERMPAVESLDEARRKLAEDKQTAFEMVALAGEEALATQPAMAPWDPTPHPLGYMLLQMVIHLNQHKAQLFYYLKLQGKPVNTGHLWGMAE
ncbi:MAG TPA: DinB family protein [Candidatus Hydrogenedentes bacterium]|nr:DinB family protein [Candidatus Hydrogenedentota bacterium]HPG65243.1 DinB family protein [Candidatus Hydrogenedentota bacterium]